MSIIYNSWSYNFNNRQHLEGVEIALPEAAVSIDEIGDNHFIDGSFAEEEANLKSNLKFFPNLRFSFMKISFINLKTKKISALALAIILVPLKVMQDIYYHVGQLLERIFETRAGFPNNNIEQISSRVLPRWQDNR